MNKLYTANTTKIEDRQYTIADQAALYPIEKLVGHDTGFYGGRVTSYGRVKDNPEFILLIEYSQSKAELHVVDIAVEDLAHFPRSILKSIAKSRKIKYAGNILTEELIDKLK